MNSLFMQEICVDLILPEACALTGFGFKRMVLGLNGQLYPQDLIQARFEYFSLTKGPVPNFVINKMPAEIRSESWQCISITPDDDELAAGLLKPADLYTGDNIFAELLKQLTAQAGSWILVFTNDCDKPQEVFEGNLNTALKKVSESMESSSGFMVYHNIKTSIP
ncbi:hypothetical protein [Niabella hibiscisoli]|uniref:hypothetical protein n=1 Tax=Niabella hibiscisoli TaxID=1825928 RepID=UPI001F0F4270|nr:hypothetical protein [Niabella hibiscisoli]MCH5719521.1 hypothetical protein [Niabella hibiscisoli]